LLLFFPWKTGPTNQDKREKRREVREEKKRRREEEKEPKHEADPL